jgi:hypothetical protein
MSEGVWEGGVLLTIVDYDMWYPKNVLHLGKSIDDVFCLGSVTWNVQLFVGAIRLLQRASRQSDLVAVRRKRFGNRLANVWTGTDDESDGKGGSHWKGCWRIGLWLWLIYVLQKCMAVW